jgi:hypothetical protein
MAVSLFFLVIQDLGWRGPVLFITISFVLYLVYDSHTAGISHIPGPFIARYTNLHAFVLTWRAGRHGDYLPGIHEKYGDVVRVGPRTVSVADPDAIKAIYNSKLRLHKVLLFRHLPRSVRFAEKNMKTLANMFANQFENVEIGKPFGRQSNIATMRDPEVHGHFRKPIANAFALSTLLEYQPVVDNTLDSLFTILDRESTKGEDIDVAKWVFYCKFPACVILLSHNLYTYIGSDAFDLIGNLSFGKPIGFLEQGKDMYDLIRKQLIMTDYVRLVRC